MALAMMQVTPMGIAGRGIKWLWGKSKPLAITAVVVVGCIRLNSYIKKKNRRKKWNNAGKDVVVLHMFPRGCYCPNLSPFVVKLETYLRMADIPYQVDFEEPMGPKGKSPWITLNGEEIGDSQLVMEKLGTMYNKDFSSHLTPEQKAVAVAMRVMIDEHLLWCLAVWRYVVDAGRSFLHTINFPWYMRILLVRFRKKVKAAAEVQGTGLHTYADVEQFGRKDIGAVSAYLGVTSCGVGSMTHHVVCLPLLTGERGCLFTGFTDLL